VGVSREQSELDSIELPVLISFAAKAIEASRQLLVVSFSGRDLGWRHGLG
jgi:hypothetical protein